MFLECGISMSVPAYNFDAFKLQNKSQIVNY